MELREIGDGVYACLQPDMGLGVCAAERADGVQHAKVGKFREIGLRSRYRRMTGSDALRIMKGAFEARAAPRRAEME